MHKTMNSLLKLLLFVWLSAVAVAQVSMQLVMPSQMPERVPSWTEEMNSQIQVILTNTSRNNYMQVRLSVSIYDVDRGRTLLQTKDNDGAMPRFNLLSGQTVTRFAREILDRRAVSYDRSVENVVITTNSIPEGNYEICVSAIDQSGMPITMQEKICRQFFITIPDPPALIAPAHNESMQREALPTFVWTPITGGRVNPGLVQYRLRVVPVFANQNVNTAFDINTPLIDKIVRGTTYQYLPSDTKFEAFSGAVGYVWEVQSLTTEQKVLGRNNGKSERFQFGFVKGKEKERGTSTTSSTKNNKQELEKWSAPSTIPTSTLKGKVRWAYRATEIADKPTALQSPKSLATTADIVAGGGVTNSVSEGSKLAVQSWKGAANSTTHPLAGCLVRLSALGDFESEVTSTGTTKKTTKRSSADKEIVLGTTRTTASGDYSFSFIAPVLATKNSYGEKDESINSIKKKSYRTYKMIVRVESPYFIAQPDTFVVKETVKLEIDAGTQTALARSFRLKVNLVDLKGKAIQDTSARVDIYRTNVWYDEHPEMKAESSGKIVGAEIIQGMQQTHVARIHSGGVYSKLLVSENSLNDRYYVRVTGSYQGIATLDTTVTFISVAEASIARDGVAEITKTYSLQLVNRSIVRGKVERVLDFNPTVLSTAGKIPVVLVPISSKNMAVADTSGKIVVQADVATGSFIFNNVPKGTYMLQTGAATAYLDPADKQNYTIGDITNGACYAAILELQQPKIIDTSVIIYTPLTTVKGRMVNEIGNPVQKGKIQVTNENYSKTFFTDGNGQFVFTAIYGTNTLHLLAAGHIDTTYNVTIYPEERWGYSAEMLAAAQKAMEEANKKIGSEKTAKKELPTKKRKDALGEIFTAWGEHVMEGTLGEQMDRNGNVLKSFLPSTAGYTSKTTRDYGATFRQNNGADYNSFEMGAFETLFEEAFNGEMIAMSFGSKMGKDASYESDKSGTPEVIDLGTPALSRRTKLRVFVYEVQKMMDPTTKKMVAYQKAIPNASIEVQGAIAVSKRTTKTDGTAVVEGLIPGVVTLWIKGATGSNYVPVTVDVTVGAKKDSTSISVELEPGGVATGVVKDDKGAVVAGATIRVKQSGGEFVAETLSGSDGTYVLRGIPLTGGGVQSLIATKSGYVGDTRSNVTFGGSSPVPNVNFSLKKSSVDITSLLGFTVEVEAYDEATKKLSGAIVGLESNALFTVKPQLRLPFKNVQIKVDGGKATPTTSTLQLGLVPTIDVLAFGKIPISVTGKSGIKVVQGKILSDDESAFVNWTEYLPIGTSTWKFIDTSSWYVSDNGSAKSLTVLAAKASDIANAKSLTLQSKNKQSIKLWETELQLESVSSTIAVDGIHLKSKNISLKGVEAVSKLSLTVNDIHFKNNGGIGTVDIGINGGSASLKFGVMNFTFNALTITESGVRTGGKADFSLEGLLSAKNIGFSGLGVDGSTLVGGTFTVDKDGISLFGSYPLNGGGSGLPIQLVSGNDGYVVRASSCFFKGGDYFPKGIQTSFEITQKGDFTLQATPNFSADFKGVASLNIASLAVDSKEKTVTVQGTMKLGIPLVGAFEFEGLQYSSKGVKIGALGADVTIGPLHMAIKGLQFGESFAGSTFGKDEAEKKKGFKVDNIEIDVPGTPLKFLGNFYYYKASSGFEFGMFIAAKEYSPVVIPAGPATISITGGGFGVNTISPNYSITIASAISVANAEKVVGLNPTILTVGVSSSGPYISAKSSVTLIDKMKLGEATLFIDFGKQLFSATVYAKDIAPYPGVQVDASVRLEISGSPSDAYIWAGMYADVTILQGIAKGNAAILLGYNIPVDRIDAGYKKALPDGFTSARFTGMGLRVHATVGVPESEKKCSDWVLCDACIWFGGTADALFYLDITNGAFGFGFNASYGAGAKCGKVGASAGLSGGLAGGYNQALHGGWYFDGHLHGEVEICLGLCKDLGIGINAKYRENKGFSWDLDL